MSLRGDSEPYPSVEVRVASDVVDGEVLEIAVCGHVQTRMQDDMEMAQILYTAAGDYLRTLSNTQQHYNCECICVVGLQLFVWRGSNGSMSVRCNVLLSRCSACDIRSDASRVADVVVVVVGIEIGVRSICVTRLSIMPFGSWRLRDISAKFLQLPTN